MFRIRNACVIAAALLPVNLPSLSIWVAFGTGMALLRVGSLYPILQ